MKSQRSGQPIAEVGSSGRIGVHDPRSLEGDVLEGNGWLVRKRCLDVVDGYITDPDGVRSLLGAHLAIITTPARSGR